MELGPGTPNLAARPALLALTPEIVCPGHRDRDMAMACLSGLWLLHDFLDESHAISQDLATAEGSYWHAIMHRREPDAWNSKYWWRRVGKHPVLSRLVAEAPALGYDYRNPEDFVDFCERVRGIETAEEDILKQVQYIEWALLFDKCYLEANKPMNTLDL